MTLDLHAITNMLSSVSDQYAEKCGIDRCEDWYLLKLQEELGELTQQHLKTSERGRCEQSKEVHLQLLEDELADLLAHVLLYAKKKDIDLEAAIERKWLKWLN